MNKPLLIWQPNIFPDEEREIAAKYFHVEDYALDTRTRVKVTGCPFVLRGAVSLATKLGHNLSRFNTRNFVPYLYQRMISKKFWWDIPERILNNEIYWPLFIRPDSSKKLFAGQVYSKEKWREEFNYLKQKNGEKILAFVADPEWIGREWRCLFVGQELVGISDYMYEGEILDEPAQRSITEELKTFAQAIRHNDYFSPEDNVTIDIGQRNDGSYGLVEINFLETAGFYNVDKDIVYAKLAAQLL
jgi:hypothetical protein